jgi:hypothetical protein
VVDVLDQVSELLGSYVIAPAVWRAEAVDGVLEPEGFFELEALDDEPDLGLGEARYVLSGLVREFDPRSNSLTNALSAGSAEFSRSM